MTDALTIGWTQAQAATRRIAYRRLLGFTLIVQTAVGLIAVVAPVWLARAADLPGPPSSGWVQLWGVMLLIMATLYLPGCIERARALAECRRYRRALRPGGGLCPSGPRLALVRAL